MLSKNKNLWKSVLIMVALTAFFVYALKFLEKKPNTIDISIGSKVINAQVANTEPKRNLGLSYTKEMPDNAGMLFVFESVSEKNFWMRDMYFDLDIIWLDENKQVVGFFENVKKESYNSKNPELSKIYHSPNNTKYVLEVNAGTIAKLKIKTGDKLDFNY